MNFIIRSTLFIVFFSLSLTVVQAQNLGRSQLASTVLWALANSNVDTLLHLTANKTDRSFWAKNAHYNYEVGKDDPIIKEKRENTVSCYGRLKNRKNTNNPNWGEVVIGRIIYATEKVEGNQYSSILVELCRETNVYYLEIDACLSERGWVLEDDIILILDPEDRIEARIKNANRKMISY